MSAPELYKKNAFEIPSFYISQQSETKKIILNMLLYNHNEQASL